MKQKNRYRHRRKGEGLIVEWPADAPASEEVASMARYVGSAEHKTYPIHSSYGVDPHLRSDASQCDPAIGRDAAERALREGIRRKCVSCEFESGYPRYVWARLAGAPYAARLTNSGAGEYKGWPVEEHELPIDRDLRLDRGAW